MSSSEEDKREEMLRKKREYQRKYDEINKEKIKLARKKRDQENADKIRAKRQERVALIKRLLEQHEKSQQST